MKVRKGGEQWWARRWWEGGKSGGMGVADPQGRDQYHAPVEIHQPPQVAENIEPDPSDGIETVERRALLTSTILKGVHYVCEGDQCATDERAKRLALRLKAANRERCLQTRAEIEWAVKELGGEALPASASDAVGIIRAARRQQRDRWRPDQGVGEANQAADELRVLAYGIDSLYLSVHTSGPLLKPVANAFEEAKAEAGTGLDVCIGRGDLRWSMRAHGAYPHWHWIASGPACTLKIRKRFVEGQPLAYVEVRSAWLWQEGPDLVVDTITAMFERWVGSKVQVSVSRIDLAVDVQGWSPTGAECLPVGLVKDAAVTGAFVSRSTRRCIYTKSSKGDDQKRWIGEKDNEHGWGAVWFRGTKITGIQMGNGAIVARVYDKTEEIKVKGGRWREGVWEQHGAYDPSQSVTRIEYQIRREALNNLISTGKRKIHPSSDRDMPPLAASALWFHVRGCLGGLWNYLAGRWMTLRAPNGDTNRSRWPLHRVWRIVAGINWRLGKGVKVKRLWKVADDEASRRVKAVADLATSKVGDRLQLTLGETPITAEPDRYLLPDGTVDLEQVAACLGKDTLSWYGRGATRPHSGHPGASIESAAERAKRLEPQMVGTLASWAAAVMTEDGSAIPKDADALAQVVSRLLARRGVLKSTADKVPIALNRTSVRAAIKYDLGTAIPALANRRSQRELSTQRSAHQSDQRSAR